MSRSFTLAAVVIGVGAFAASSTAQIVPRGPCAPALLDLSDPSRCIPASALPQNGALLPLGPYLSMTPSGELGVGMLDALHRLHVDGDTKVEGRFAAGNEAAIGLDGGWERHFDFSCRIEDFAATNTHAPFLSAVLLDPTEHRTGAEATYVFSHHLGAKLETGNPYDFEYVQGPYMSALHRGDGEVGILAGAFLGAESTGDVTGLGQVGAYVVSDGFGDGTIRANAGVEIQTGQRSTGTIQSNYGLYIYEPWRTGTIGENYALYIEDQGPLSHRPNYSIYSEGGANYLGGDLGVGVPAPAAELHVAGDIAATGVKNFVQPHPEDPRKEIWFVCLEGNEAGTYCRGRERLHGGRAEVPIPEDFRCTTGPEGLTVQLTAMGPNAGLWVESVDLQRLVVRGESDVEFSYLVNGIRAGYADYPTIRDRAPALDRPASLRPPRLESAQDMRR